MGRFGLLGLRLSPSCSSPCSSPSSSCRHRRRRLQVEQLLEHLFLVGDSLLEGRRRQVLQLAVVLVPTGL